MTSPYTAKTVWLTGASSGIGLALCRKLLAEKNQVIATVRNTEALTALQAVYPNQLTVIAADFSNEKSIEELKNHFTAENLAIDALVLCAGVCEYFDDGVVEVDKLRRVFEVNFFSAAKCCELAQAFFNKSANERPLIVGVSSLSTVTAFTRAEAYGSSKAALRYFLESLRVDLAPAVDVSIVSPGFVQTPLTDKNDFAMPWLITAEEAANEIFYALVKRPLHHSFPKRLHFLLAMAGMNSWLWFKKIGPALKKQ